MVQLLVEQTIGVGGALAKTANRIFDDLNPDEQRIARRAFLAMVNLGEGAADTRRRAALAEIVAANEQVEDVERVLQRFSRWEVRLVTLGIEASGAITAVAWNMVRMLPTRHSTNFSRNPRLNNSCFMALWETMDS